MREDKLSALRQSITAPRAYPPEQVSTRDFLDISVVLCYIVSRVSGERGNKIFAACQALPRLIAMADAAEAFPQSMDKLYNGRTDI